MYLEVRYKTRRDLKNHPVQFSVYEVKWYESRSVCLTLCNPMDYTVHEILQTRILEWVAFPFPRGSSQPRDQTQVSCIAAEFLTSCTTKEARPKRNQLWICIGKTDAEAEAPILRPSNAKSWLTGKDPDAGKDWGQEEKGMVEDESWMGSRLSGCEFEQILGDSEGQGNLACCSPWGHKESHMTEQLNNTPPYTK